jgi:hypothetical protein
MQGEVFALQPNKRPASPSPPLPEPWKFWIYKIEKDGWAAGCWGKIFNYTQILQ